MKRSRVFAGTIIGLALYAGSLAAGPITIFNTGVNNSNVALAPSAVDPHWTLVLSADSTAPGPGAFVVGAGGLPPTWLPNSSTSQWISPNNNPQGAYAAGNYEYRTTFDLTGLNPATANLSGKISADDSAQILLNGANLGTFSGFGGWTNFSAFGITSGFVPGTNTLDLLVANSSGPSGVRLEVSGSAQPISSSSVPEPASFALLGIGSLALLIYRRRSLRRL